MKEFFYFFLSLIIVIGLIIIIQISKNYHNLKSKNKIIENEEDYLKKEFIIVAINSS